MGLPTHASIEKTRNELDNNGSYIKMTHTAFPGGTKILYAVVIMTAREYWKRVATLDSAWKLMKPTNQKTYNPSIKISTVELTKAQK